MPTALELAHLTAALVQAGLLKHQVLNNGWIMGRDVASDALQFLRQCHSLIGAKGKTELWLRAGKDRTEWLNWFSANYLKEGRANVGDLIEHGGFGGLSLDDGQLAALGIAGTWKELHPKKRPAAIFRHLTAKPLRSCNSEMSGPHSLVETLSLARVLPGEAEALNRRVPPPKIESLTGQVVGVTCSDGSVPSLSDELRFYDARIKNGSVESMHHPDGTIERRQIAGLDELAVIERRQREYLAKGIPFQALPRLVDLLCVAKEQLISSKNRENRRKPAAEPAEAVNGSKRSRKMGRKDQSRLADGRYTKKKSPLEKNICTMSAGRPSRDAPAAR